MELRNAFGILLCSVSGIGACEVPDPDPDTGGLGGGDVNDAICDRGISVVSSDYLSTAVAFVDWNGDVISERVITSGSADAALSAPLSGDVVVPTGATSPKETVLLDRSAASVLTWIDLATGKPRAQLGVRTGFDANPQDYAQVEETLGFVSRLAANPTPGREPNDEGSDLLVVDPSVPEIVGRIALDGALAGEDVAYLPRPGRLVATTVDGARRVVVALGVLSADFQSASDARVVVVDPDARSIIETLRIPGLENCQAMALAPGGDRVALGCTGQLALDGTSEMEHAGVAIVKLGASGGPSAVTQFPATSFGRPPQFSIAFSAEEAVVFPTFGTDPAEGGAAHGDELVELDLATGASRVVVTSGKAFDFGEVRCAASCGSCFLADVGTAAVRRFTVVAGEATDAGLVTIDDGIGLPGQGQGSEEGNWGPRFLGEL